MGKTKERRKARQRSNDFEDLLPGKMLGKIAKMRYGAGPKRLNRNAIFAEFDNEVFTDEEVQTLKSL